MSSFAARLKKLRNTRNVTQQDLADYLNVTRPTIAGYETKGKEPNYNTLFMIASYFDVSIDYLLIGREFPDSLNPSSTEFDKLYEDYMLLKPKTRTVFPLLIERTGKMDDSDVNRLLEYASLLLCQPKYHSQNEK
ncbi:MAG: helix-turn-helix domain-containing protein [Lachnospiraceae bacterium]|nr:helix-turn-helix domain-containing protein [Lachnospiraceae bacterium]